MKKLIIRRIRSAAAAVGAHDATSPLPSPSLTHVIVESLVSIGSDPAATINLDDPRIAAEQAVIVSESDSLLLISRAEGTILNSEALAREARCPLEPGDTLHIADFVLTLAAVDDGVEERAETSAPTRAPDDVVSPDDTETDTREVPARRRTGEQTSPVMAGEQLPPLITVEQPLPRSTSKAATRTRSFAEMIDGWRAEEDCFRFAIEGGAQAGQRILIERAETPLGWDAAGEQIICDLGSIGTLCAIVRKSWSGVVVQPQDGATITVNDVRVDTSRRLRDGDRLALLLTGGDAPMSWLVFHEPTSLLVLDSLLPEDLPAPVRAAAADRTDFEVEDAALSPAANSAAPIAVITEPTPKIAAHAKRPQQFTERFAKEPRHFARSFTSLELTVLLLGTALAVGIVYAVLRALL